MREPAPGKESGGGAPAPPRAEAGSTRRSTVGRVVSTFVPYRRKIVLVAAAILVSSALGVANPVLIKTVFDRALFPPAGGPDVGLLVWLVGMMIGASVVAGAIGIWQAYLTNVIGQRVMQDLRGALYAHLQHMPLRFFTDTRTGEIQSRLANDVGGVRTVVTDTASTILSNSVILISTVVAMLIISWPLTVLSLGMMPVFVWLTHKVGTARRAVAASTQRSMAELSAITEETLSVSGILLSKVFGRQRAEIERFRAENQRLADLQVRQQMMGRSFFAVVQIFFSVTPALVYLVAGLLLAEGRGPALSAGTVVAFTTLQSRLFFPLGQMLQVSVEAQSSLALFERIFEYLDLPHEIVDDSSARDLGPESVRGRLALRHVWFRYDRAYELPRLEEDTDGERPPGREWALQDVSLEVEPGQLAALVGPSGAGKTTVAYLVPRLYDVDAGSVEIDDIDVRKVTLASLGRMVGMVTQENYLFHATIRDNLRYGNPEATDEELESAARAAFIHDRILELPEGYDTVVGERGYRMSGGEKQRLAIARVILSDPRILVLDEATSALDSTSEHLVQEALKPLMAGRTTIAIAHRLSTVLAADVIFVLDRGRVVERGTHAELLAAGRLYARLYQQQFHGGLVEARCKDGLVLSSGELVPAVPQV